jgi:hypothetical protein
VDSKGNLHVVYFKGDAARGDLFYVTSKQANPQAFSQPIRVNSVAGSAVALGTIRGAQMAIADNGNVYVVWNGSNSVAREKNLPMLFSRMGAEESKFSSEHNLLGLHYDNPQGRERILVGCDSEIDGGGAVAAGNGNMVYVLWHAVPVNGSEKVGQVWVDVSKDAGQTFRTAMPIKTEASGTCGCCGMQATFADGKLFVLYRTAKNGTERDTTLLTGNAEATSFTSRSLQGWHADVCPMSLFSFAQLAGHEIGAWETTDKIYCADLSEPRAQFNQVNAKSLAPQKYPSLAAGDSQLLVTWTEGAGWNKGGVVKWKLFDKKLQPISHGNLGQSPAWNYSTALAFPNGQYAVIF